MSKFKPIEPYKIPELASLPAPSAGAPPSTVEVAGSHVRLRNTPNRPNHLCTGCRNHFEYVRQRDAGPRATGRTFAEWVSYCKAGPELLDLSEETVYRCTKYENRRLRRIALGIVLAAALALGTYLGLRAVSTPTLDAVTGTHMEVK